MFSPTVSQAAAPETSAIDKSTLPTLPAFDYNPPEWLQSTREGLMDFFSGMMSPEYTMFGAPFRGAVERDIGRRLESSQQDIINEMRRRGIGTSGIESQMLQEASLGAAREAADVAGRYSLSDEQARQWAASQLEGLRRFGAQGEAGLAMTAAGIGPSMFATMGPQVLAGPAFQQPSLAGFLQSQEAQDWMYENVMKALEAGELTWADAAQMLGFLAAPITMQGV